MVRGARHNLLCFFKKGKKGVLKMSEGGERNSGGQPSMRRTVLVGCSRCSKTGQKV